MNSRPGQIQLTLSPPLSQSIAHLLRAYDYANDAGTDPWQLSVELELLWECGITLSDIRWLLARGFIRHACETTAPGDEQRFFRALSRTAFPKTTCIVLTEEGAETLRRVVPYQTAADFPPTGTELTPDRSAADSSTNQPSSSRRPPSLQSSATEKPPASPDEDAGSPPCRDLPTWDPILRELRFRGELIKRYRVPSVNQELVLSVFQEEGWPRLIDDPLPPAAEIDPKRRLQWTVKSLNRHQTSRRLRFHANGNGSSITWEPLTDNESGCPAD